LRISVHIKPAWQEFVGSRSSLLLSSLSLALAIAAALAPPGSADSLHRVEGISSALIVAALAVMAVTAAVAERSLVTPYTLFLGTLTLFMGGRFITTLLGFPAPTFDSVLIKVSMTPSQAAEMTAWLLCVMFAMHAGYLAGLGLKGRTSTSLREQHSSEFARSLRIPAAAILAISALVAFFGLVQNYIACSSGGYLAVYQSQSDVIFRSAQAGSYGLLIGTGLAFASRQRVLEVCSLLLLFVFYCGYLVIGIRGGLLSLLLMFGWIAYQRFDKKIALAGFIALVIALFPIAQLIAVFGCRANINQEVLDRVAPSYSMEDGAAARIAVYRKIVGVNNALAFLYDHGTAMVYVHAARQRTDYPWPGYIQTFVPGFSALMALSGSPQKLSSLYFGQHFSQQLIPESYARGETLGWTLYGDFHVFSRGIVPLLIVITFVTGMLFALLSKAAQRNSIWFGALVCIFPKIMFLPRAGLYSIFPFLAVFFAVVGGWWVLAHLISKHGHDLPSSLQWLVPVGRQSNRESG
jgi:hypothetical protein